MYYGADKPGSAEEKNSTENAFKHKFSSTDKSSRVMAALRKKSFRSKDKDAATKDGRNDETVKAKAPQRLKRKQKRSVRFIAPLEGHSLRSISLLSPKPSQETLSATFARKRSHSLPPSRQEPEPTSMMRKNPLRLLFGTHIHRTPPEQREVNGKEQEGAKTKSN